MKIPRAASGEVEGALDEILRHEGRSHRLPPARPRGDEELEGVTSLTPAGAALGILTLTETTKWKVAVGKYNKMIDKRMAEIKAECGL